MMKTIVLLAVFGTAFLLPAQINNGGGSVTPGSTVTSTSAVPPLSFRLAVGDTTSHISDWKDAAGNIRFFVGPDGSANCLTALGAVCNLLISGASAASTATPGTGAIGFNVGSETIPKLHWGGNGIDYGILLSSSAALVNVPATLNWAQTTDSQDSIAFGETSAATGGTITNGLSNQTVIAIKTLLASTASPLSVVQGSISGTVAFPAAQFQTTWNNVGLTGMGLLFNLTDTNSAAGSLIFDFRKANTSQLKLDKSGNLTALGTIATTGAGAAGGLQMKQGTANGHGTANTVTIEAPAAVTAYEDVWPGTSASGFLYGTNSAAVRTESFGELSGDVTTSGSLATTVGKVNGIGIQRVTMTADWTCGTGGTVSSCVAATIVGSTGTPLTITLPSVAASYHWQCDGVVGQATAATANSWNFLTATNGATNVTASYQMNTAATAMTGGAVTDQASTTTTVVISPTWTLGGTATKMPFHITGSIEGASASGTVLSLQLVAPTVGDLVTIYRGATCSVGPF